jgi:hypothetical protein
MPCESSKIKRINTRREQNRRFYSDIVLRVRVKSAILRFKAKDEALSLALDQHGHKHFVVRSFVFYSSNLPMLIGFPLIILITSPVL